MTFLQYGSVFTILGVLALSVPARADVPPEDACSASNLGQGCSNALIPMIQGAGTGAGVCQAAMCTRSTPDGSITYQCYRCVPVDDGGAGANNTSGSAAAGGTPSSGSGGASAGGTASAGRSSSAGAAANAAGTHSSSSAGAANSKSGSDDGGCSLSHARSGGGALGAALIALGLTFAGIRRRRSLTS